MFLNWNPCRKTQPMGLWTRKHKIILRIGVKGSTSWHPHSPPLGESKLNLNLVDDAPSLDIVSWKLSVPAVRFGLTNLKKTQQTQNYINSSIYNLSLNNRLSEKISPTVLKQRKELLRWLYPRNELINLLHVGFQTTVQYIQQSWGLFF